MNLFKKTQKTKVKKTTFRRQSEDKELFDDVVFLVEATSTEHHMLWCDRFYKPVADFTSVKSWKQEGRGLMITIGEIDERPICVDIQWDWIEGKRVMFYYGCSQLVDHKMIEDWLKYWTLDKIRWDNGTRWAHCNAMNFHHCLDAVKGE